MVKFTKKDLQALAVEARAHYVNELSEDMIKFLDSTDFFHAPASGYYHGAHTHGLCIHSMLVAKTAVKFLAAATAATTEQLEAAVIAGLLHDVCKINSYKPSQRWRKVDGKWQSYQGYEFLEDDYPMGHGEKSLLLLAEQEFHFTREVQFAIRWHMGLPSDQMTARSFSRAMQFSPVVAAVSAADIFVAYNLETQGTQEDLIW